MKILCLGGGPAGLYFGILMKRRDPSHHITIIERNWPDDTFGFGVVFPESAVGSLQNQDEQLYQNIARHCQVWDPIEVRFRGKTLLCHGNGFSAISRKQLLTILQQRAGDLGIHMHFQTEFRGLSLLQQYDLVIAADGVNSLIRRSFANQFRRAALPSLAWWEEFRRYRHFSPEQFTLHCLTRNPSITVGKLGQRAPALIATVHDWFLGEMQSQVNNGPREKQVPEPLFAPLRLGSITLPHRLVTALSIDQLAQDHPRAAQASLVSLKLPANANAEISWTQWQRLVAAWRTRAQARIGLHIPLLFSPGVPFTDSLLRIYYRKSLDVAEALETDVLELDMPFRPELVHWRLWETVRSLWAREKLLTLRLTLPEVSAESTDTELVTMVERFKIYGCDLIGIALGPIETKRAVLHQRLVSDLIRNEVHLPTMLVGNLTSADEINTLILSARTDLYLVQNAEDLDLNGQ